MSKAISGLFAGTAGEEAALILELEQRGEKFSKKDVIAIYADAGWTNCLAGEGTSGTTTEWALAYYGTTSKRF